MAIAVPLFSAVAVVGFNRYKLNVLDGSLTFSEQVRPYIEASLTVSIPNLTLSESLDPRAGVRVVVTHSLAYIDPVSTPVPIVADLWLHARNFDRAAGTVTLTLRSDEAMLMNAGHYLTTPNPAPAQTLRAIVNDRLSLFGTALQPGSFDANFNTPAQQAALIQQPGTTHYAFLAPLVQQANGRLFADESRRWWLADDSSYTYPGQVRIQSAVNVVSASDSISLSDGEYYDAVVVKYSWTDANNVAQTAYDASGTGSFLNLEERTTAYPGSGAAANILRRAQGRGRVISLTALSDLTVRPGMSAVVTLTGAPALTGVVSAVTFNLSTGLMDLTTRGLTDTPQGSYALLSGTYAAQTATYQNWS